MEIFGGWISNIVLGDKHCPYGTYCHLGSIRDGNDAPRWSMKDMREICLTCSLEHLLHIGAGLGTAVHVSRRLKLCCQFIALIAVRTRSASDDGQDWHGERLTLSWVLTCDNPRRDFTSKKRKYFMSDWCFSWIGFSIHTNGETKTSRYRQTDWQTVGQADESQNR
jgi:hypothetical protein